MPVDLSVVIPAYNEAHRLAGTLTRILEYLGGRGLDHEVVVVDDGSTDGTAEVARRFAGEGVRVLRQEENRGKGAALKAGVVASRGARVLLTDADLSTPIEALERLEPHLSEAELVFGSRAVAEAEITRHQPIYRELMGKSFNLFIRLLGVRGLHDTQCGFKLLDGDVARRLFGELRVQGFAYDVELVLLARQSGCRLAEVGVVWEDHPDSKVRLIHSSAAMLWDVLRLRLRAWSKGRP
jgi:dolichyl-phosphate beta-glucosyltransferase